MYIYCNYEIWPENTFKLTALKCFIYALSFTFIACHKYIPCRVYDFLHAHKFKRVQFKNN